MASLVTYKGLSVLDAATGLGGIAINQDLRELGDRVGSVASLAFDPGVGDDDQDSNANGYFYQWSKWYNTVSKEIFVCTKADVGAAVWTVVGSVGVTIAGIVQGSDYVYDLQPTLEGVTAGGIRGENSVDLQTVRAAITDIASATASAILSGESNQVDVGQAHGVICGGESNILQTTGNHGFIGGGILNDIGNDKSVVCGGYLNSALGDESIVCGGDTNTASGGNSFVGGGRTNTAAASKSIVVGGSGNVIGSGQSYGFIGGGKSNEVKTTGTYGFIGGGQTNDVINNHAVVCGGLTNIASGDRSAVCGGNFNYATNGTAFVGGGKGNEANGSSSNICGGYQNEVASVAAQGSILGGRTCIVYDDYGTIGGGLSNLAVATMAFIGGGQSNIIQDINDTITVTFDDATPAADTITRGSGSWITDGYLKGMRLAITGTASNNKTVTIANVTALVLTIVVGETLIDEVSVSANLDTNGSHGVIGGGAFNETAGGKSAIVGGQSNEAGGDFSFVGGGTLNRSEGKYAAISGGSGNYIVAGTQNSIIVGGSGNGIDNGAANYSFIGGGVSNRCSAGNSAIVGGGSNLIDASDTYSFIGGGYINKVYQTYGVIGGGYGNHIKSGASHAFIGGGEANYAYGDRSVIPGGSGNHTTALADYSMAMGKNAQATLRGEFVQAMGNFANKGDAQGRNFTARGSFTHNSAAFFELTLDGAAASAANRLIIPTDSAWTFDIVLVGIDAGLGVTFSYRIEGVIENDGTTVTVPAHTVTEILDTDGNFSAQVTPDNTNKSMKIEVSNAVSGGQLVRWAAYVRIAAVTFPA